MPISVHRGAWVLSLVILLGSSSTVSALDILLDESVTGTAGSPTHWVLRGDIEKGDLKKLRATILQSGALPRSIALDSSGGDINEAIEIGLFLRRALIRYHSAVDEAGTAIAAECSSACALIFFGAIERQATADSLTRIGLHQPSFNAHHRSTLTQAQADRQYAAAEKTLRLYLHDMSIPDEVADIMFTTDPSSMSYFSDIQLAAWFPTLHAFDMWLEANCGNLVGTDPVNNASFADCQSKLELTARKKVLQELGCDHCRLY